MFNINKNQEQYFSQAFSEAFTGTSTNQKKSVLNFFQLLITSDGDVGDIEMELVYLNYFAEIFNIDGNESTSYLERDGMQRLFDDLNSLTEKQKDFLVISSFKITVCDGRPNEKEIEFLLHSFHKIGIPENRYKSVIEETMLKNRSFLQ